MGLKVQMMVMSLKDDLVSFLGGGERRVVMLGIGSSIRSDDAVGPAVVDNLKGRKMDGVLLLNTDTRPENFTGLIRQFDPTHVIMVDAAHLKEPAGTAKIIPKEKIGGEPVSTHHLPLTELVNFIEGTMNADVVLIGIQPLSISYGTEMTDILKEAAKRVSDLIFEAVTEKRDI